MDGDGKLDLVAMADTDAVYWYKIPAEATKKWQQHYIGKSVHGGIDPGGVGEIVGDYQDLAGPGHGIDSYISHDHLFGRLDPFIAGSYDLVNAIDRISAMRQSRHSLGSADSVDAVDFQFMTDR